jgi:hypothetical protein
MTLIIVILFLSFASEFFDFLKDIVSEKEKKYRLIALFKFLISGVFLAIAIFYFNKSDSTQKDRIENLAKKDSLLSAHDSILSVHIKYTTDSISLLTKNVKNLTEEISNYLSGGNSYCVMTPVWAGAWRMSFRVVGKNPLDNVKVQLVYLNGPNKIDLSHPTLNDLSAYSLGRMFPERYVIGKVLPISDTTKYLSMYLYFESNAGFTTQEFIMKLDGKEWCIDSKITNDYGKLIKEYKQGPCK